MCGGVDHHGTVARVRNAGEALGYEKTRMEMLLVAWVRFVRDGVEMSMSKRAGTFVTLDELLEEIGVDSARWYFASRSASTAIDFDIEAATARNSENPVYYAQYAHARMQSILRKANAEGMTVAAEIGDLSTISRAPTQPWHGWWYACRRWSRMRPPTMRRRASPLCERTRRRILRLLPRREGGRQRRLSSPQSDFGWFKRRPPASPPLSASSESPPPPRCRPAGLGRRIRAGTTAPWRGGPKALRSLYLAAQWRFTRWRDDCLRFTGPPS